MIQRFCKIPLFLTLLALGNFYDKDMKKGPWV